MINILIFGDSIAQGYYDTEGGWADRLKRYYLQEEIKQGWDQSINVFNLSLPGDTSHEVLAKIDKEIPQRVWDTHGTIFIFAVGINDSIILKNGKNKTSKDDFKNNLEKLYSFAKKYSNKIFFVGLMPVDESKVTPMPWSPDQSYFNKSIKEYSEIIKNFCKENEIHFIDLWEKFNRLNYSDLLEDGAHPNTKGHELMFKIVKKYLSTRNIA